MAMLANHLEQINHTAKSIGELQFAPSRPFTNALLHNAEITALIRDTEPHERGLFSLNPSFKSGTRSSIGKTAGSEPARRETLHHGGQASSAVAKVLGSDLLRQIRSSNRNSSRGRRVDVEILLQGAEKLCGAYDVAGATARIATLRKNHDRIIASIRSFEDQVSEQQMSMGYFNTRAEDDEQYDASQVGHNVLMLGEDDIKAEEDAIKELEAKKKALEARVAGMERDLGGILG